MPKLKSHSGAKKRVRKTGSGKYVLRRGSRSHLLQQKSKRQKRLNRLLLADSTAYDQLKRLTPYLEPWYALNAALRVTGVIASFAC